MALGPRLSAAQPRTRDCAGPPRYSIRVFMSDPGPPLPAPATEYLPAEVYVVPALKPRYWLHLLLFLATIFTTLVVGAKMEFDFLHNAPPFVHGDELLPLFPVG